MAKSKKDFYERTMQRLKKRSGWFGDLAREIEWLDSVREGGSVEELGKSELLEGCVLTLDEDARLAQAGAPCAALIPLWEERGRSIELAPSAVELIARRFIDRGSEALDGVEVTRAKGLLYPGCTLIDVRAFDHRMINNGERIVALLVYPTYDPHEQRVGFRTAAVPESGKGLMLSIMFLDPEKQRIASKFTQAAKRIEHDAFGEPLKVCVEGENVDALTDAVLAAILSGELATETDLRGTREHVVFFDPAAPAQASPIDAGTAFRRADFRCRQPGWVLSGDRRCTQADDERKQPHQRPGQGQRGTGVSGIYPGRRQPACAGTDPDKREFFHAAQQRRHLLYFGGIPDPRPGLRTGRISKEAIK